MFPGCGGFVFVSLFFLYYMRFHISFNDFWNSFAHPSLSLVISYNEDGYNEDNFFLP